MTEAIPSVSVKKARKRGLLVQRNPVMVGPEHREQSCTGKVRYGWAHYATVEGLRLMDEKKEIGPFAVYRCGYCGGWHLGKAAKTIMARLRVVQEAA